MAAFQDSEGNNFSVRLTVADLRTLKELGAHPDELLKDGLKGLAELLADAERVVSVLYALTHKQFPGGRTPEQFAEIFDGDTLERGSLALLDAITDFIPSSRRAALRELRAKLEEIGNELASRATKAIQEVDAHSLATSMLSGSPAKSE